MAIRITDIHFELLGVTRKATQKDIKSGYRLQMSLWHPDKFPNDEEKRALAEERSKSINEAYGLLKTYKPNTYNSNQSSAKANYKRNTQRPKTHASSHVENVKVNSSTVNSIGYVPESKTLIVEFASGRTYEYYNVPLSTYDAFLNAPSKGKFVHTHLQAFEYTGY